MELKRNKTIQLDLSALSLSDLEMEFQLVRQMASIPYRGASFGECVYIAKQLKDCSEEQWTEQFNKQAQWQENDGLLRMKNGNTVSSKDLLFTASNSYKAAEFYSPAGSAQRQQLGKKSVECFKAAMKSMKCHFEAHQISYKDISIPTYFIAPAQDGKKRKTIMIVSGFAGTMEEEFLMRGLSALERNYNVILFSGPGQLDVTRSFPDSYLEPDFENVVKRVIDFFDLRFEIDKKHLILMGINVGGYFALRAACFEPRICSLVLNPPIVDLHAHMCSIMGADPSASLTEENDFTRNTVYQLPEETVPIKAKKKLEHLIAMFGQESYKKTFEYMKQFTVKKDLKKLSIPCLALSSELNDPENETLIQDFCNTYKADLYVFSEIEGATALCQIDNPIFSNAVVFDWLENL